MTFCEPHGPFYHYEEATNITFGDQPNLRDPLDKKYIYIKGGLISEGIFTLVIFSKKFAKSLTSTNVEKSEDFDLAHFFEDGTKF